MDTLPKLVRVLGMLGSAHPGERDAAALAAERIRRQMGSTWDDLLGGTPPIAQAGMEGTAGFSQGGARRPDPPAAPDPPETPRDPPPFDFRSRACAVRIQGRRLTAFEMAFLRKLEGWWGRPSPAQLELLDEITRKRAPELAR